VRVAAHDRSLSDWRKAADFNGAARLLDGVDVGVNDSSDAIVKEQGDIGIVDAAHPYEWRNADRECGLCDALNGFEIEDRVLAVDEQKVMPACLGNARDIRRTGEPDIQAEYGLASSEFLSERMKGHDGVPEAIQAGLERIGKARV
jgi:hypothetical protein